MLSIRSRSKVVVQDNILDNNKLLNLRGQSVTNRLSIYSQSISAKRKLYLIVLSNGKGKKESIDDFTGYVWLNCSIRDKLFVALHLISNHSTCCDQYCKRSLSKLMFRRMQNQIVIMISFMQIWQRFGGGSQLLSFIAFSGRQRTIWKKMSKLTIIATECLGSITKRLSKNFWLAEWIQRQKCHTCHISLKVLVSLISLFPLQNPHCHRLRTNWSLPNSTQLNQMALLMSTLRYFMCSCKLTGFSSQLQDIIFTQCNYTVVILIYGVSL